MESEELSPYKLRAIYTKRHMNAIGYVKFWEIHVKKHPDKFAVDMLNVARKILERVEAKIENLD